MIDEAAVGLELRLAGPSHPDSAARFLEVRPHARQTRQHVFELRELDLELGLARPRARREDVEDQFGAIHDALASGVLDVLALRRRELVVEDDERRALLVDECPELVDLSLAEIGRRVRPIDLLRDAADDDRTGGVRELLQLLQMLVQVVTRRRPLPRRADEQGALDGRSEGDQVASDGNSLQSRDER
jgi:hypothetical protein